MFRSTRKKIHQWEEAGLISGEQATELQFFENTRRNFGLMTSQVALGFILLGVVAIGASSWAGFSDSVRIWLELATIIGASFLGLRYYRRDKMLHFEWCVGFTFALTLCFLISLDYWYRTTGEPYWMLGLWAIITAPTILYIRSQVLLLVWSLLALAGVYGAAIDWSAASEVATVNVVLSLPFLLGVFALFGPRHLKRILGLEAVIVFAFNLFSLSFTHAIQPVESAWVFLPIAIAASFWFGLRSLKQQGPGESIAWLGVMGAYSLLIVINYGYMHSNGLFIRFIAVMLCILGLVTASFIAHKKRTHHVVRLLLGLGIARAIVLYYEALGGLLFTGFGLIITGLAILSGLLLSRKGYRWLNHAV